MADLIEVFRELGDPTRLRVLASIAAGRKNVSAIVSELGLSQPQVSYHLRRLKDAGLAVEQREGRRVWYEADHRSADVHVRELLDLVSRWSGGPGRPAGALEEAGAEEAAARVRVRRPRGPGAAGGCRRKRKVVLPGPEGRLEDDEGRPVIERPEKREHMEDFLL